MKATLLSMAIAATTLWGSAFAGEKPSNVRILYIGNEGSARARQFEGFLEKHFAHVRVANREGFDPGSAKDADVVLLDWSQHDIDPSNMAHLRSPLGARSKWSKPTVLLGSAGLLLAGPWKIAGSHG